jgi:polygalacturonase
MAHGRAARAARRAAARGALITARALCAGSRGRAITTMLLLGSTAAALLFAAAAAAAAASSPPGSSSSKVCAITDHGADAAAANNTAAIASAIAACLDGGTVKVAGGAFKTGPLLVAGGKDVFIEVASGASLVAAFGPDKWPVSESLSLAAALRPRDPVAVSRQSSAGSGDYQDFLVFDSCDGCGLIGEGTLFGKAGRPPVGFDWYYLFDQGKLKHGRPNFLVVNSCKKFTLRGVTLLDAPCFNVSQSGSTLPANPRHIALLPAQRCCLRASVVSTGWVRALLPHACRWR